MIGGGGGGYQNAGGGGAGGYRHIASHPVPAFQDMLFQLVNLDKETVMVLVHHQVIPLI